MIQWFKDVASESIFFKGFMLLMVASFGIWGIGDVIRPSIDPNVVIKGGRFEVRADELRRQLQLELDQLKESLGPEAGTDPQLRRMVLNQKVEELRQTAVANMAALEMGVSVSQDLVRESIMSGKEFKDASGQFNQMRLNELLVQNRLTERDFTTLIENGLRQNTLLQPVGVNAAAPDALVDKLFAFRGETRIADTILITVDSMNIGVKPTDEQLKKVYDENTAVFTAPEYRNVSAVLVTTLDLVPPDSIDEAAVRQFYDENIARYRTPEQRRVYQLVFDTKEQAEAARALAAPGDTLAKIAEKAKAGAPVDLGERPVDDAIVKPFGDAAKLPAAEISQPVETELGWHLVQTTKITPQTVRSYDDVRAEVRKLLAEDKGVDALQAATTKLEDEIAAGTPFADIAGVVGGRYFSFPAIDRRGVTPGGSMEINPLFEKITQELFYKTAFTTAAGQESQLADVDGGYWVLKVESITPPAPKNFDQVKGEVATLWLKQEKAKAAKSLADNMSKDLGPSVTMTSLGDKDKRLSYARLGPITRFGESLSKSYVVDSKRVSPDLLAQLFKANVGEVMVASVNGGYVIARLQEIIPARTAGELAGAQDALKAQTRNAVAQDLLQQFSTALSQRYPIELNAKTIEDIAGGSR